MHTPQDRTWKALCQVRGAGHEGSHMSDSFHTKWPEYFIHGHKKEINSCQRKGEKRAG
jgi:hypothetical protein